MSSDYELMLRFLYKRNISWYYLDKVLVKMRIGGMTNRDIFGIARKSFEDYRIGKLYGFGIGTLLRKNLRKIPQFFQRQ
jgi:glycosyltransferase